jgi:hypothetical protein
MQALRDIYRMRLLESLGQIDRKLE